MTIKPLDIRRKEFKNSLRGYDQNQVDDFLDSIADEFEKVFSENQRMKDQVSTLRERLEQFDDLEGSIRAALVHAEQAASNLRQSSARDAENVRQNAQRDAELTIREAKSRAHQILADSSSRVERIQESYEALREARGTFAADFRHLLSTYMSVMENMDIATAKEIEASLRERLDPESIAVAREAAAAEGETRIQPPL
ncbi:MAG: DivIVA domain-containing protein, partial [Rubrobacteraceae bacterium]